MPEAPLYFGFQFRDADGPMKGMFRLGDKWSWPGKSFNLIVTDHSAVAPNINIANVSHNDDAGVLWNHVVQDEFAVGLMGPESFFTSWTTSRWLSVTTHLRGLVDLNYGYADGAVIRINRIGVEKDDERLTDVPHWNTGADWPNIWSQVPVR